MRKVSTAKQGGNFSEQKLMIGLDLGDRSSCYYVLDETGHILVEQRVSTTPQGLQAAFGAVSHCRIALETGMHSPWASRVNPARSIGPAIFVGGWALQQLWLFIVAPLAGATLAAVVYSAMRIPRETITPPVAERALPTEQKERVAAAGM